MISLFLPLSPNARPRHRDLLRRNRRGRLRHGPRAARARAAFAGRDARGLRRRGAGTRVARPRPARGAADAGACWRRPASRLADLDGIAYTRGPGLAGALLVGASVASALAYALGKPAIGVHHLEGHLLSPLLVRPASGLSLRRAAGFRRPQPAVRSRGRRALPAARRHAGRCGRRGLRQDGEAAGPALSGRAGARGAGGEGHARGGQAAASDATTPATSTSASRDSRPRC